MSHVTMFPMLLIITLPQESVTIQIGPAMLNIKLLLKEALQLLRWAPLFGMEVTLRLETALTII